MTLLSNYSISGTCLLEPASQCVQDSVPILEDFGGVLGLLREARCSGHACIGPVTEDAGYLSNLLQIWEVHLLSH